ncbi:beta-lactamase-like protein [Aspergillus carlsbadensis]|nr:beta-lactamase-like protein [Aspergillus carlsbadensis]
MGANSSPDPASLLIAAGVPAFKCPPGTKMHILNLGTLQADESWILRGANASCLSEMNPVNKRRDLVVLSALIEYPGVGLILFETGCAEDLEVKWPAPLTDVFPRTEYTDDNKLPAAIKAAGYNISDISAVIIGHLHLDHAGGLEHFLDTGIPVYVHEEEFKHACWAVATGADLGVYLGDYLNLDKLNWKTFTDPHFEIFQGITLHHAPGHTPGLCMMQVNLEKDGVFLWTTDQFHVRENYEAGHPHGGLARDHTAWYRSLEMARRLVRIFGARLVFGHDKGVVEALVEEKKFYE